MNLLWYLLIIIMISRVFSFISYMNPALGSLLYLGILIYGIYYYVKKTRVMRNVNFNRYTYNQQNQHYSDTTNTQEKNEKRKNDAIDVEFCEREVE